MSIDPDRIAAQLQQGVAHHRAGALAEAEKLYRQVLQAAPNHVEALELLANLALQTGRHPIAETMAKRALAQRPDRAELHFVLASALLERGKNQAALQSARRAVELAPHATPARLLLASALRAAKDAQGAEREWQAVLAREPNSVPALYNLAKLLIELGRKQEATALLERAVATAPNHADALALLGQCSLGQNARQAISLLQQAIQLGHRSAATFAALGEACLQNKDAAGAQRAFEQAVALEPRNVAALDGLAELAMMMGQPQRALELLRQAMSFAPRNADLKDKYVDMLSGSWQIADAVAFVDRHAGQSSTLDSWHCLFANVTTAYSSEKIFAVHRDWGRRFADPLTPAAPRHANDRNPTRRLKVGYVSHDFRRHSVTCFFQPLLQHHNRQAFEIFLYDNNKGAKDDVTVQLHARADHWRDIAALDNEAVAALVRQDGIDILVDLAGHTGPHRLEAFARRPAPLQMTYLGYIDTTGIQAMDYRLVDDIVDPPGMSERWHTEKLLRLAGGYLCYQPLPVPLEPGPPPMLDNGFVTFGSFNNLAKVTPQTVRVWGQILQAVPNSRLLIKDARLAMPSIRDKLQSVLAAQNIAADRLELRGKAVGDLAHLQTYRELDVALDPFPYNGVTTTCEALWMGVPVVALLGQRSAGRHGADILTRVGVPELIASDVEAYIATAVALAADPPRLAALHAQLRAKLLASPLCDAARLAREVEGAYRQAWRQWCDS